MSNNNYNNLWLLAALLGTTIAGIYITKRLYKKNKKTVVVEDKPKYKKIETDDKDVITFAKNEKEIEIEKQLLESHTRTTHINPIKREDPVVEEKPVQPTLNNLQNSKEQDKKKEDVESEVIDNPKEDEELKAKYTECIKLFSKGKKSFIDRKYEDAIEFFNQAYSICPENKTNDKKMILYSRASCYKNLKQYDQAITDLDSAIVIDPLYSKAYISRAQVYEYINNIDKALSDYCYAYTIDLMIKDEYIDPSEQFSSLLKVKGKIASNEYIQYIKSNPDKFDVLPSDSVIESTKTSFLDVLYVFNPLKKTIEELEESLSILLSLDNTNNKEQENIENETISNSDYTLSDTYAALGDEYMKQSKFSKALECYENAKTHNLTKNLSTLYIRLAFFALYKGQFDKTSEYIQLAENIDGKTPFIYALKITLMTTMDENANVDSLCDESLAQFPEDAQLHFIRGLSYETQTLYDQAKDQYLECLKLDSNNSIIYLQLTCVSIKKGDYQSANNYVEKALEIDPKNTSTLSTYGDLLMQQGRGDLAEQQFKKAIEYNKKNSSAYVSLAILYMRGYSDLSTAEVFLQEAIMNEPDCVYAFYLLAECSMMTKNFNNAREYINKAIEKCTHSCDLNQFYQMKILIELTIEANTFIDNTTVHL